MAAHRPLCGNHLSLAAVPAFSDASTAERQPRGLGLVSSRAEPLRPTEAFRSSPSGRVPRHAPFFLFPLQLDADSQVRRYSPYSGMKEAIACVLTSFAQSAPADTHIIIRNHPLDNGLIDYAGFIASFAAACGISERVQGPQDDGKKSGHGGAELHHGDFRPASGQVGLLRGHVHLCHARSGGNQRGNAAGRLLESSAKAGGERSGGL